ncbi:hypothetical protein [Streptomyces sp. NPDC048612]|uniref:hypothetical protein n=1 Tax=Streptomyces sp. NPDC048612 TaxID=3365579 RepID=UPI00371F235B
MPGVPFGGHTGGRDGHGGGRARRDLRGAERTVVAVGSVGTREHHGQQSGDQEQQDGRPTAA